MAGVPAKVTSYLPNCGVFCLTNLQLDNYSSPIRVLGKDIDAAHINADLSVDKYEPFLDRA